jgi:hypothetical protein
VFLHINTKPLSPQAVTGGLKNLFSFSIDGSSGLSLQQQHKELQQVEIDSTHMP